MSIEHQMRLQAEQNDPDLYPPYDFTFRGETFNGVQIAVASFLESKEAQAISPFTYNQRLSYRALIETEWEFVPMPTEETE